MFESTARRRAARPLSLRAVMLLCALAAATLVQEGRASGTPPASEIVFLPASPRLDNPATPDGARPPTTVALEVVAHDEHGERIAPSAAHPLHLEVSGGPAHAITPRAAQLTTGSSVTFAYDGSFLATPLTLAAWIDAPGGTRKALGRTELLLANPVDCVRGRGRHVLRVLCARGGTEEECGLAAIRRGLKVRAAVGYDDARDHLQPFAIDTGSIGTVVPAERLGPDAIGPGAPGSVYYDSSGRVFSGDYYLASVAFETEDGRIVQTPRMLVLGIRSESCAPGHRDCRPSDDPGLHYLGVGFARGSATHALRSPADNAFLRLADAGDGDVSPGYVLTGRAVTIGVPSTDGYRTARLAPSTTVPGDWSPARACYSFPALPEPNRFCGNFLLDVGIAEMFLDLPRGQRPRGAALRERCGAGECVRVPDGTAMRVAVGEPDAPAMAYDFTVRRQPSGPEPTSATWIDRPQIFVNVGRRPLLRFHYLFDATCGNVGFARVE